MNTRPVETIEAAPIPPQFTFNWQSNRSERPSQVLCQITGWKWLEPGKTIEWQISSCDQDQRSLNGDWTLPYKTGLIACPNNRLTALLNACDYPVHPQAVATLNADWLVGVQFIGYRDVIFDREADERTYTIKPIQAVEGRPTKRPWE